MASSDLPHDGPRPESGRRARGPVPAPGGVELVERTAELTSHLGSTDHTLREGHALPLLLTWVDSGAHDHVLASLGDGMADGLGAGRDGDQVSTELGHTLRRAGSAQVLAAVARRDNSHHLLHPETVLDWAESLFAWLVREPADLHPRDLRTPGPVGHGADVLAALADSRHFDRLALTVLLDVIADRLLLPALLSTADIDLLARATTHAAARDLVDAKVLDPWVRRLSDATLRARPRPRPASGPGTASTDARTNGPQNAHTFLRALQLRVALGPERFDTRADLLITLNGAVRSGSPALFEA